VELELDFLQPVGDVFVVDAFDEDAPLVRVVCWGVGGALLRVEELGFCAEDCVFVSSGVGCRVEIRCCRDILNGRNADTP
jgi:hypothetical protein